MLPQPLPTINLPVFEGPLDLLLHLIREHKVDIANIPIEPITDQYIAYINAMEESNLAVAGEFFVMAATLLEIKTRMLLPKPPVEETDDDEMDDPRLELIERLQEYEKFKVLVGTFQELEDARTKLFIRDQANYGDMYELPVSFGEVQADALLRALQMLLADAEDGDEEVTSVRRQKMSLKMAIRTLARLIKDAGKDGIDFLDAFPPDRVRLDIIMTFLAMLELLRQGKITAKQTKSLGPIRLYGDPEPEPEPSPVVDEAVVL
ncbi:MAG TPA: segregation/condensation protein A [Capsulimonadaceae bacterium]|jgi:segregation and condensation protein A